MKRKIDILRKKYGRTWHYEFPSRWVGEKFTIQGFSRLTPTYPEDDETCTTEYRRSDTGEIYIFNHPQLFQ